MNRVYLAILAFAAVMGATYASCYGGNNDYGYCYPYSYPCGNSTYNSTGCYDGCYGYGYPGYGDGCCGGNNGYYGYGGYGYGGCGGCGKKEGFDKDNKLCCLQSKIATKLLLRLLPHLVELVQKSSYCGNYNGNNCYYPNGGYGQTQQSQTC